MKATSHFLDREIWCHVNMTYFFNKSYSKVSFVLIAKYLVVTVLSHYMYMIPSVCVYVFLYEAETVNLLKMAIHSLVAKIAPGPVLYVLTQALSLLGICPLLVRIKVTTSLPMATKKLPSCLLSNLQHFSNHTEWNERMENDFINNETQSPQIYS